MSLEEALKIVREEGYIAIKLSTTQLEDYKECERRNFEGECFSCSCSICIAQE